MRYHSIVTDGTFDESCIPECYPGAHIAVVCPFPFHKIACAIEDAGFEIRDTMIWLNRERLYGIILGRLPLDGSVAQNTLKHGCGGLNIDDCRITISKDDNIHAKNPHTVGTIGAKGIYGAGKPVLYEVAQGRWPANLLHDGFEEVIDCFPNSKSCNSPSAARPEGKILGGRRSQGAIYPGENGSAARFFYTAKTKEDLMVYLENLINPPGGNILRL